jgi:hypothetical protein
MFGRSEIFTNSHRSCENCDPDKELMMYNPGYGNIMSLAGNEAVLLLKILCGATQFGNIYNEALPYCEPGEIGGSADCRCCAYIPNTANATQCTNLASPQSRAGGILSMMAKYDHGLQLDSTPNPNFGFVEGSFTIFMKRGTPNQYLTGYPSAYAGFISTQNRLNTEGVTSAQVQKNAALTADMKAVCYPLFCPTVAELAAGFAATFQPAYMQNASCEGLVPGTDVLMSKLSKCNISGVFVDVVIFILWCGCV